ncbi:FAD-dependent oxidoreductase [Candidatus Berkelbacteria bacterium]|nr:FAD-dependent oxidoreductase [Candidatus Berkelbacteria bacterium]
MHDGNPDAFDVVVIGSGAAGLAAARGAARLNQRVALVERDLHLGGDCPNYACIPTKTLLAAAKLFVQAEHADEVGIHLGDLRLDYAELKRAKDHVVSHTGARQLTAASLAQDGITLVRGPATLLDAHTVGVADHRLAARQIVVATGSRTQVPSIRGLDRVPYLTSQTALDLTVQPHSLIILGAGPVGVEFAQLFSSFGTDVTLISDGNRILPRDEPETATAVATSLSSYGARIVTDFHTESVSTSEAGVRLSGKSRTAAETIDAQHLLVATGQTPNLTDLGLETVGVETTDQGIVVDDELRTTVPHIWAAGDVIAAYRFTHAAHTMGVIVGHNLTQSTKRSIDFRVLPRVVFTHLELASVGQTEAELRNQNRSIVVGAASIGTLGRALTDGEPDGLVKLVADRQTGQILGASIAAPRAGEMIHELALAMHVRATVHDLASLIHAFPTYSEAIAVAAAAALKTR